jgi:hypothetical protein
MSRADGEALPLSMPLVTSRASLAPHWLRMQGDRSKETVA